MMRISSESRLADWIADALRPYSKTISSWNKDDLFLLFWGMGNLRFTTPSRHIFSQTFWKIAVDIRLALDELGFEDLDYEERDFYYAILCGFSEPWYRDYKPDNIDTKNPRSGIISIREDLFNSFRDIGMDLIPMEGYELDLLLDFGKPLKGEDIE